MKRKDPGIRQVHYMRRKRKDPNFAPVKLETRKRVRLFLETGTWRGTDEDVAALKRFYQVTFRDNPPEFENCGKCFKRACQRMHEYWAEQRRKKWED